MSQEGTSPEPPSVSYAAKKSDDRYEAVRKALEDLTLFSQDFQEHLHDIDMEDIFPEFRVQYQLTFERIGRYGRVIRLLNLPESANAGNEYEHIFMPTLLEFLREADVQDAENPEPMRQAATGAEAVRPDTMGAEAVRPDTMGAEAVRPDTIGADPTASTSRRGSETPPLKRARLDSAVGSSEQDKGAMSKMEISDE